MEPQHVFNRVLASFGLRHDADLARALGRGRGAAWIWRHHGFPKRLHSELQVLAAKLQRPLPPEFYTSTGIPSPQSDGAAAIKATDNSACPQNPTGKTQFNSISTVEDAET